MTNINLFTGNNFISNICNIILSFNSCNAFTIIKLNFNMFYRFEDKIKSISNYAGEKHRAIFVLDNKGKLFKVEGAIPQGNEDGYDR